MKVSVIIPVKNGSSTLERCLESIKAQQDVVIEEIIILDSASSDTSISIAERFGTKIISVKSDTFNHGLTRNLGVEHAKGDLIFFTVQDAWLSENDMLFKMSSYFNDDAIMGVVGHQAVPHENDKNPLLWFRRFTEPEVQFKKLNQPADYHMLNNEQKKELIAWDNVVAMYRKTALEATPFSKTAFAEDWIWSRDALLKGYTLVYDPSLLVYHYHHMTYDYAYRMQFTVNYHMYKYFGFQPSIPKVVYPTIRAAYHLIKNKNVRWSEKWYWFFYNIKANIAFYKSNSHFYKIMKKNVVELLELEHNHICSKIPQGKQKKIN